MGISFTTKNVSAARYGAKLYTTPRSLRGTWHFKSSRRNSSGVRITCPYSRINIGRHTITFSLRHGKKGLRGRYTFYKAPNRIKHRVAAYKYALKHKWLMPYSTRSKSFGFSSFWGNIYEEAKTGEISRSGRSLTMANAFYVARFGR